MNRTRGENDVMPNPSVPTLPGFSNSHQKPAMPSDDEEDLGLEAKKEIEIEDELDGTMVDPNAEQRAILARALKEEQLR